MTLESKVQAAIRAELKRRGWLVTKLQSTSTNGWPDLLALKYGYVVFIEVKRPGGELRPLQQHRMEQIKKHGGQVVLMDDVRQVGKMEFMLGIVD